MDGLALSITGEQAECGIALVCDGLYGELRGGLKPGAADVAEQL